MGFDNLVAVFWCSIVTYYMSKRSGFSMASTSWVIVFGCSIGFNKLEAVLGFLTATNFMSSLFGVL